MLEAARLRAERLLLDKRIHNQRVALRQNWEITEMRNKDHHRAEVRTRLLAICCRLRAELNASQAALAEAEARGRRQGLEEAAKNDHSKDFQLLMVRIIQRHRNGRDLTETLEGAADLLKRKGSLSPFRATAPAETQKPETGEIR